MNALEITTNIGCFNCDYCPQDKLLAAYKSKDKKLTIDEFRICLDKLTKNIRIHFSGFSEPFFNSEAVDMIEYAFKKGHPIIIYTTTIGLTLKKIKQLKKYKFEKFVVHCPDEHTKFNINTWFKNIKYLEKEGIDFELLFVGERSLNIKMFKYICEHFQNKIISQDLITRAGKVSWIKKLKIKKGKIKCFENRFLQNILLPNGDVYLCCMDYGLEYKLGNLFLSKNFKELQNSEIYNKIREGFMENKIRNIPNICKRCERAIL